MPTAPVKTSIGCLDFGRQCNFDQVCDFGLFCITPLVTIHRTPTPNLCMLLFEFDTGVNNN